MLEADVQDYGVVKFSDFNWVSGVNIFSLSRKTGIALPEDIGRFYSKHQFRYIGETIEDEIAPTVPCKEAFAQIFESFDAKEKLFM